MSTNRNNKVKIAQEEGYNLIHPFDGPYTLQGTSTLGLEIYKQFNQIDVYPDPESRRIRESFP